MKQITVTKLTCPLFLLLLLVACTEAEVIGGNHSGQQTGEVETTFNLEVTPSQSPVTRSITFTAQGSTTVDTLAVGETSLTADTLQTRSATDLPDAQEKKVAGLWIGQYDADGTTLLSHQYIESVTGTKVTAKLVATTSNCNIRFVANAGDLGNINTEALLNTTTLPYASTDDGRPASNLFAMTGAWTGSITENTGTTQQTIPTVELTRLAAKITFTYKINGTGFSFEPTSVSLKNVPDQSQVGELTTQLSSDVTYGTYTGTTSTTGATMYWYLPENMAGTGTPSVNSEKEKTGQGVTNPTYIELFGDAVQNGVKYENVAFRFYPGKNENDYNIKRNDHFIMSIDLKGLDISDKRITVGAIPPITVNPAGNFPVLPGDSKDVQITSRAGVVWSLRLPQWLSATIDGQTTPPGSTLTNQGPCKVTFTTTEINSNTTARDQTFTLFLDEKGTQGSFKLIQDPLVFNVIAPTERIAQTGGSLTGSITVSEGFQWAITPETSSNGITVSPTAGNSSTTELTFTAPSNSGNVPPRTGTFTVSAKGGTLERTLTVQVTQEGLPVVKIDQDLVEAYKKAISAASYKIAEYPPFNYDYGNVTGVGSDYKGTSSPPKISTPYYIEVSKTEPKGTFIYSNGAAKNQCPPGWRIPMIIELFAMYQNRVMLLAIPGFTPFIGSGYWSSSSNGGYANRRSTQNLPNGNFTYGTTSYGSYVRCVQEVPP